MPTKPLLLLIIHILIVLTINAEDSLTSPSKITNSQPQALIFNRNLRKSMQGLLRNARRMRVKEEWRPKNKLNPFVLNEHEDIPALVRNKRASEETPKLTPFPPIQQPLTYNIPIRKYLDTLNLLPLVKPPVVSSNIVAGKKIRAATSLSKTTPKFSTAKMVSSTQRGVAAANMKIGGTSSAPYPQKNFGNPPYQAIFSMLSELKQMISMIHQTPAPSSKREEHWPFLAQTTPKQTATTSTVGKPKNSSVRVTFNTKNQRNIAQAKTYPHKTVSNKDISTDYSSGVEPNCVIDTESRNQPVSAGANKEMDTSNMIEQILVDVEAIKMQQTESMAKQGLPCNITGSWSSLVGGMLLNISEVCGSNITIKLQFKSPPSKTGFLINGHWNLTGLLPFSKSEVIIVTGVNLKEKRATTFIGECRCCDGTDSIAGSWLVSRVSRDCKDQRGSEQLLTDVWTRETLTELRKHRLESIRNQTAANNHHSSAAAYGPVSSSTSTKNKCHSLTRRKAPQFTNEILVVN